MTKAVRVALLALMLVAMGAVRAPAIVAQLPDLAPFPPFAADVGMADDPAEGFALRFSVTTMNVGDHDLQLVGAPPKALDRTAAQQCVAWAAVACTEREEVGDFVWHPAHGHWHFEDFALYELRALLEDGSPDPSPEGLVAGGDKVTFCLADTEPPQGPIGQGGIGVYTALCPGAIQGISAGWGDTYHRDLPGQQIVLNGVEPGDYALVVTIDPDARLREMDRSNNVAWAPVTIPPIA